MFAVESVNSGGEACRFPGETGEDKMTSAACHQLLEQLAGIAGWPFPLENHVGAGRFKSLYPPAEHGGRIEKRGSADLSEKRHRKAHRPCVVECRAAVRERGGGIGHHHEAPSGDI